MRTLWITIKSYEKKKQIITAKSHSTAMKNDNSMTIKPQFYHSIPIESL